MFLIDIYREPSNDMSIIFTSVDQAFKYLIATDRAGCVKICPVCAQTMTIKASKKHLNSKIYACKNKTCRHEQPVFHGFRVSIPKIPINTYLRAVYKWIENHYEKDCLRNLKISKKSYQNIKKNILDFINIRAQVEMLTKIGGGKSVQIDETAICHGFLNIYPSKLVDDAPGVTWLVGIIEEETGAIRYVIVPDRKIETLSNVLKKFVKEGTKVISDGFPSYPAAVSAINGVHVVVNHKEGFKNAENYHTNNIENFWSILKYEIKIRRGIKKTSIETFLNEYWYRYTFLRKRNSAEIFNSFNRIVDFLFNIE